MLLLLLLKLLVVVVCCSLELGIAMPLPWVRLGTASSMVDKANNLLEQSGEGQEVHHPGLNLPPLNLLVTPIPLLPPLDQFCSLK